MFWSMIQIQHNLTSLSKETQILLYLMKQMNNTHIATQNGVLPPMIDKKMGPATRESCHFAFNYELGDPVLSYAHTAQSDFHQKFDQFTATTPRKQNKYCANHNNKMIRVHWWLKSVSMKVPFSTIIYFSVAV